MYEFIYWFKWLQWLIYIGGFCLGVFAGYLVYSGLSTQHERIQTRIRINQNLHRAGRKLKENATKSKAENWLKQAGYPLGLDSFRYYKAYALILALLLLNYVVLPLLVKSEFHPLALVGIAIGGLLFSPSFPYSLFTFLMRRIIDYRIARRNSEIFMLYDLIINELEMMTNTRINTYSILRGLKGYFHEISTELAMLLSDWGTEGPDIALNKFAKSIGTRDAKALVSVLRTLDNVERHTAIESLKGLNNMLVRSQIENYRRRRKISTDLATIPIKATHFLTNLNFLVVIILMVMYIMEVNRF